MFGGPGSGKTQVCLTTAALCALEGGVVAYIDTRGDLWPARLQEVVARRAGAGQEGAEALARIRVARAVTPKELCTALEMVASLQPSLLVLDSLSAPLMPLVTEGALGAAFMWGSRALQLVHRLVEAREPPAVLAVSGLRAGREGGAAPALGGVWRGLADTRLLLVQVSIPH